GIEEAVAPMGTALTAEQVAIVGRLAKTVVVVFDWDAAGQRAAQKVVPLFVEADVDGRVARMPAGVDPDDFVRTQGAAAFRRLVEGARPMLDQFIQDAVQEAGIQGKVNALETVAALLVKVRNQTTRELYARQLGGVLGLTAQQVGRALREAAQPRTLASAAASATAQAASAAPAAQRPLPREELHFLILLVTFPELGASPEARRGGELLIDADMRRLFRAAAEQLGATGRIDIPTWLDAAPPEARHTVALALHDGSIAKIADPAAALRKARTKLELLRVEAEIKRNGADLDSARTEGNEAAARAMMLRGIELKQTVQGLKAALERP